MAQIETKKPRALPSRRPLWIFASDPMLRNLPGSRITVDVANETLRPGPCGSRIEVIDYDGDKDCFYRPVDLDDRAILMQNGLLPTESDPSFHQQMVYAVAMKTLENFEMALGRRLEFKRGKRKKLRILPHAFHGENAFYDSELNAILFGYFRASKTDPGPNLPGQYVYTCLSHDIIAHEFTHAVIDRLRMYSSEPSNPDVLAFHEGVADIVALFQHFSYRGFLKEQIQTTRTDIRQGQLLVDIARQFGYATGSRHALRSAIGKKNVRLSADTIEPHDRGSILVAAVFDAFFSTYQSRIRDLLRIATGGTGKLPDGDLHPDLVNRIAVEASKTAQSILIMCMRAFDYLPPVDLTFGDYLRAMVTADFELVPEDQGGLRSAFIESFRAKGIYPDDVVSLAEESLIWPEADRSIPPLSTVKMELANKIALAASAYSLKLQSAADDEAARWGVSQSWGSWDVDEDDPKGQLATELCNYAQAYAPQLNLDPRRKIHVAKFHPIFRVAPNGQLMTELVVQFLQQDENLEKDLGGIPFRGGTTIVAGADGRIRYVISKPLPTRSLSAASRESAMRRLDRQKNYLAMSDRADPRMAYAGEDYTSTRARLRARLSGARKGVAV